MSKYGRGCIKEEDVVEKVEFLMRPEYWL